MRIADSHSAIVNPQWDRGDVAQLGEHLLCKQGVSGSIPLISTTAGRSQAGADERVPREGGPGYGPVAL